MAYRRSYVTVHPQSFGFGSSWRLGPNHGNDVVAGDYPAAFYSLGHTGDQPTEAEQISEVEKLRSALDGLHRTIAQTSGAKRYSRRQARNRKLSRASQPNFSEGDFVLVAVLDGVVANKLSAHWRGPRRIIAVESEWVYHVQDLLTQVVTVVHSSRIKFYDDASLNVSEELLQHVAFQQSGYEVSTLRDVRWSISNSRFEVLWFPGVASTQSRTHGNRCPLWQLMFLNSFIASLSDIRTPI